MDRQREVVSNGKSPPEDDEKSSNSSPKVRAEAGMKVIKSALKKKDAEDEEKTVLPKIVKSLISKVVPKPAKAGLKTVSLIANHAKQSHQKSKIKESEVLIELSSEESS
jgi:hypothetical protein